MPCNNTIHNRERSTPWHTHDLSTLPGKFNATKAANWSCGNGTLPCYGGFHQGVRSKVDGNCCPESPHLQSERRNAGASSCAEKRRTVLCRRKEQRRKNEVPINDDSLGFFPHGRVLGCLFCYKSVWNKRAACIGTMQNEGGTSQQAFCNAKVTVVYTTALLA